MTEATTFLYEECSLSVDDGDPFGATIGTPEPNQSWFYARQHVRIGIFPRGRVGTLRILLGRSDIACYAGNEMILRETDPPETMRWVTILVPKMENERDDPVLRFPVHVAFVTFTPESDVAEDDDEASERRRVSRIDQEMNHYRQLARDYPNRFQTIAIQAIEAIWGAVDDLDAVCHNLHPVDVVQKHLQRGNIERDGKWT